MGEMIFKKGESAYIAQIDIVGPNKPKIELDTGSPISVISIPVLLSITGESLVAFRKKANDFIDKHGKLSIGAYGSEITNVKHSFIPYLVKDITIGGGKMPYIMFWVDITKINTSEIVPTSTLMGFDIICQRKKSFDENDDFHMELEKLRVDTLSIRYALSNTTDEINLMNLGDDSMSLP